MQPTEIRQKFRRVDRRAYQLLDGMALEEIYEGSMGPGGLFLASRMSWAVELKPGMRVMDLGCGRGRTSLFLAQSFDVTVYALDLWITATELFATFQQNGFENQILPFNLDVTQPLPFADDYFDVIFCMDAFHYFGANDGFLKHLAQHLRPGGQIVIGNPCFNREFTSKPPAIYDAFWQDEFSKYHSPEWWAKLFQESGCFEDVDSREVPDGVQLWEDELLYSLESGNTKDGRLESDADEIIFGHDNPQHPYLTHFILTARKQAPQA